MSMVKRGLISFLIGLVIAGLFNMLLFDLSQRSLIDQILSISFSTAAFGFISFLVLQESTGRLPDSEGSVGGYPTAPPKSGVNHGKSQSASFLWLEKRSEEKKLGSTGIHGKETRNFLNKWIAGISWPERVKIGAFLRDHLPGIVLAFVFVIVYFYVGRFFNNPDFVLRDNYLDADNSDWIQRIAGPDGHDLEMRAPHPFAFFIFRPLGWTANLFFRDPSLSAMFLNAFAGGLSVFLTWFFVKTLSKNRVYALLMAALLGLSTSHFVFGSIVESYIFSALTLISFYVWILARKESTGALIAISLLSFGITLTNFVQTFIGFFIARFRWKELFRFTGLVISLGIIFTLLHSIWYPSSKPFFLLASTEGEGVFMFSLFNEPSWNVAGRIYLLARTIFLYSIIAPLPFVFLDEVNGYFPSFQFFELSKLHGTYLYSEYNGLGNVLLITWIVLLLLAGLTFFWNFVRTRKVDLSLAFLLCLLFNFLLHLNYGEEPFLYSPDWTYALIFFVAMGLRPFAKYRLFQIALLAFLFLLAYNQWQFFKFVMDVVTAHLG